MNPNLFVCMYVAGYIMNNQGAIQTEKIFETVIEPKSFGLPCNCNYYICSAHVFCLNSLVKQQEPQFSLKNELILTTMTVVH